MQALIEQVRAMLAQAGVPGASIAVTDRDGTRLAFGVGLADLATGRRMTESTHQHLFSGTKLFTATVVLQLVEAGACALEDEIRAHLPSAQAIPGVTIAHLLSHRSGLRESVRGLLSVRFGSEPLPSAEEALTLFPLHASRAPGTIVEYRNTNYVLLGALVSRLTGREYRDEVRAAILAPLGMTADFAAPRDGAGIATGYIERWDPMRLALRYLQPAVARRVYRARHGALLALEDYDLAASAIGGLRGTVTDFARFLRAHLADGAGILRPATADAMRARIAPGAAGIVSRDGVGLGWKLGLVDGRPFLNHEGGGAGATSELRIYPREGIGIALAMNAMRMPRTMRLAHRISEATLKAIRA